MPAHAHADGMFCASAEACPQFTPATQPAPAGNGPEVLPVALEFLTQCQAESLPKYGTVLRAHNGRSALRDAKEEAADQLMYLTQLEMEWPALVARVRREALTEVEQLVERHFQAEHGPAAEPGAVYGNAALRSVYADVRELLGKSPAEPEPVRRRPTNKKQHRWRRTGKTGHGRCADCAVEQQLERGPRGGPVIVYSSNGVELVRGPPSAIRVPPCQPPPKGEV